LRWKEKVAVVPFGFEGGETVIEVLSAVYGPACAPEFGLNAYLVMTPF